MLLRRFALSVSVIVWAVVSFWAGWPVTAHRALQSEFQPQATLTVTTTADSGPGSLRQALTDARTSVGPDTILFNIPASQATGTVFVIKPLTPLPALDTGGITVAGETQPNTNALGPEIFIDGSTSGSGLKLQSGANVIRNIGIFRCSGTGILITGVGVFNNAVQGCYIGVNAEGTAAQANKIGIQINSGATGNVIGGTLASQRNVISGNTDGGIVMEDIGTAGNIVAGNLIGLNAAASASIGNSDGGVIIRGGAAGNRIGGTSSAEGNVIAGTKGSGPGILLTGAGTNSNLVQGNLIGTNAARQDFGNGGEGVRIVSGASRNLIGGKTSGAGNVILFNDRDGVAVGASASSSDTLFNTISRNTIYSNGGQAIDLGSDGITANDAGDTDIGPNNLLNRPILGTVTAAGAGLVVTGQIDTPDGGTVIEIFASFSQPVSQQFLGEVTLTAAKTFSLNIPQPDGKFSLTATATDTQGNTSEFSSAVTVDRLPDLQVQNLTLTPGTVAAGGLLNVSFMIRNDGTDDASSSSSTLVFSTDSKISLQQDTTLTTLLTPAVPMGTAVPVTFGLNLPTTLVPGTYYIGVIADTSFSINETNENNNSAAKSFKVVAPKPDLAVGNVQVSQDAAPPGGSLTVSFTIMNEGLEMAGPTVVQLRLSTNATINNSDPLLVAINMAALPGGGSLPLAANITIPVNTQAGNYFIGVTADATNQIAEDDEKNNSTTIPLTVSGNADFAVDSVRVNPTSIAPGGSVTVDFVIRNRGNSPAEGTTHDVLISTDNVIRSGEDLILVSRSTGQLSPNETASFSVSVTIPEGIPAGSRFIGIIADSSNVVSESSETNNTRSTTLMVLDRVPPVVQIKTPNGGEAIAAGRAFLLQWSAGDAVGVVSQDIRLSTDGGTTFPAQIAIGISGNLSTFLWSVPTLNTTAARIQITARDAAGNSGTAASAANFTVAPPPRINSAKLKASGKLILDITGSTVAPGAVLQVKVGNTTETFALTINDALKAQVKPSTLSTPGNKTTLQLLPRGTSAILVLVNPNGIASDGFALTVQ
ncbi:MAG: hypothetical protein K1Y36_20525 [Blastocatellia bacterium]|nr:hypothetical protein [Blastocatellia bacterium]